MLIWLDNLNIFFRVLGLENIIEKMKIINVVVMLYCVFMNEYVCLDLCKG